jgi:hypothetical protein
LVAEYGALRGNETQDDGLLCGERRAAEREHEKPDDVLGGRMRRAS